MTTLTVTAKGQITLKKSVLAHLGIGPGRELEVTPLPGGRVEVRAAMPSNDLAEFVGCLSQNKNARTRIVSIAEMNEAIAAGWTSKKPSQVIQHLPVTNQKASRKRTK
jgi:antitoxin PrlF